MAIHKIFISLFIMSCSSVLIAQQWNGRVERIMDKEGNTIDSVKILDWPETIPEHLKDDLDFTFFFQTRLHNNRIDLRYMNEDVHYSEMSYMDINYWRGNFAIYKSSTSDLDSASLYKYGVGIGRIKFPVYEDGHYLAIIVWGAENNIANNKGEGRMIYCIVKNGQVYLHKPKNCD